MEFLMNPENITLLIGALVALVGAVAFAIRQVSLAANSWVETRNKVRMMTAEIDRLKAEAEAREQDGENERDTKIINILERLTDQNGRWPPIAENFATAQNRYAELFESFNRTNEKVAAGLTEMAKENKALRISMESWPQAVDANLENLSKKVEALETAIGQVVEVVETGNSDHVDIRTALDGKVVPLLMDIHALVQKPPPDDPTTKDKPAGGKILNADAGDHSAVKLPKTG